ncbi:hypothetical protein [Cohnella soli]|uniref:Uncharacterized protein n=1 Tax=Cohnella soli TaxID=425005 RepID=A0ABW0HYW4_9BACL
MSEFSESYHLHSNDQEEGVSLLKRAGVKGFVYPQENNWVTILPEGDTFQENKKLITSNEGTLVHYIFAEDHCWSIDIFEGANRVFQYECS